jgi:SAM-dependent methyltransferase
MPTIEDVRQYWNERPLLSYELDQPGSPQFFAALDRAKREDSDKFALSYWEFDRWPGMSVLDIGCGPGWLTVHYAKGGAKVEAVDITPRAVEIASAYCRLAGVAAHIQAGNAEALPFPGGHFDRVVSSGVLHHTPDTMQALRESFRVLKPGGAAKITLYRKSALHSRLLFPLTRLAMRVAGLRHPGADLARTAQDADDFIRQYDGAGNPVGIGKSDEEWANMLHAVGYRVQAVEVHYFPKRFLPFARFVPERVHRRLDRRLGTMAYFTLSKPN